MTEAPQGVHKGCGGSRSPFQGIAMMSSVLVAVAIARPLGSLAIPQMQACAFRTSCSAIFSQQDVCHIGHISFCLGNIPAGQSLGVGFVTLALGR